MLAPDTDPAALAGLELVDRRGERLGRVRQVYPEHGVLAWAGVRGNLIGTTEALVPLDGADLLDDVITVPITRSRFLAAPRRSPDAVVDDAERDRLRRFYDESEVRPEPVAVVAPRPEPSPEPQAGPAPAAAAVEDGADHVQRLEQRLLVTTEPVPRSRVVLRKVVVTEQRTITVPVRREELRLVREPIEHGEPVPGAVLEDSEQQLVLHEERVVVTTEVVPVERIRLVREVLTEDREVTGEVWHERLESGGSAAPTP